MDKEKSLDDIAKEIEECLLCRIETSGKAVPGEGKPSSSIVFVGEAPGKTEAATGSRLLVDLENYCEILLPVLVWKNQMCLSPV